MNVKLKEEKEIEMKIKTQKEKGITLIALIVTIIILLILSAVTILSFTGKNGVLNKTKDAKIESAHRRGIRKIKIRKSSIYCRKIK